MKITLFVLILFLFTTTIFPRAGDTDLYLKKTGTRMNGRLVEQLQKFLLYNGFSIGEDGVDGWFGQDTEAAVKEYQKFNKLEVTGVFNSSDIEKDLSWKPVINQLKESVPSPEKGKQREVSLNNDILITYFGQIKIVEEYQGRIIMKYVFIDGNNEIQVAQTMSRVSNLSPSSRFIAFLDFDYYGSHAVFCIDILTEKVYSISLSELERSSKKDVGKRDYYYVREIYWSDNENLFFSLSVNFRGSSGHPGVDANWKRELGDDWERDSPVRIGNYIIDTGFER